MTIPDFWDFLMEGGWDLLYSQECPHCGKVIYPEDKVDWVDKKIRIFKCPRCGEEIEYK